jgi:hypothetical protein
VAGVQRPVDGVGQVGPYEGERGDDGDGGEFTGTAAPGLDRAGQFDDDGEPGDARQGDEVDLDAAEQFGSGEDADGVERDDDGEAGETEGGEHENGLAGVAGEQVQAQPPAQREDHCRQRSHVISVSRR